MIPVHGLEGKNLKVYRDGSPYYFPAGSVPTGGERGAAGAAEGAGVAGVGAAGAGWVAAVELLADDVVAGAGVVVVPCPSVLAVGSGGVTVPGTAGAGTLAGLSSKTLRVVRCAAP